MINEEIKDLELLLKEFGHIQTEAAAGTHLFLESEIAKVSLYFLNTRNQYAEIFLRNLLKEDDCGFKFLALYTFLKAQELGINLQEETLKELKRIKLEKENNPELEMVLKCVERRLNSERPPNFQRR